MLYKKLHQWVLLIVIGFSTSSLWAQPCSVVGNGLGTVNLPASCSFQQTAGQMQIVEGLPQGTTINISPQFSSHTNRNKTSGGSLCGGIYVFDTSVQLTMSGTGALNTFSRVLTGTATIEVHTGEQSPGKTQQHFDTEMISMNLEIFGDPDFDFLFLRGGNGNGLPSPGETTLTRLPSGNFNVDSFFDIEYQIEFQGAPGSALEGMQGTTTGNVRMQQGETPPANHNFGLNHQSLGNAALTLDATTGHLTVSNIGSSGEDGVSIDGGEGTQGFWIGVDFGPAGSLLPGSQFIVDSFFDIEYRIQETDGGRAGVSIVPNGCHPELIRVELLNQGNVVDSKEFDKAAMASGDHLVVSNIGSSGQDGVRIKDGGSFNVDSFFDIEYRIDFSEIQGNPPVLADQIRVIPLDGCDAGIANHSHHGHVTVLKAVAHSHHHHGHVTILKAMGTTSDAGGPGTFTIQSEALGLFNRPHTALGNGHLTVSNIGSSGLDGVRSHLVVSNIGSSGQDGVRQELPPDNIGSSGLDGVPFVVDFGQLGNLVPGSHFDVDSFFDITYCIRETNGGGGGVIVNPGTCLFESVLVEAMLDDAVVDSEVFPIDHPAIQTRDALIVSNIGSSGQDGVRVNLGGGDFNVDSFFDIDYQIEFSGTTILGHTPVNANRIRMTIQGGDPTCTPDNSSVGFRAGGLSEFAIQNAPQCGDLDHPSPIGDLNFDCVVNIIDLSIFSQFWLLSTFP